MAKAERQESIAQARLRKVQNMYSSMPRTLPRMGGQALSRVGYSSTARTRGAAVQGEMKYFDCTLTAASVAAVTTTWGAGTILDPTTTVVLSSAAAVATPLCLFAPTVGAGLNQRIGRNVKMMKVKVTGHVAIPNQFALSAGTNGTKVRIMLVLDRQTNASQMASANLINDSADASSTICAYQNPNFFGRFQVLKEKTLNCFNPAMAGIAATNTVFVNGAIYHWKMNYNLNGLVTHFNATTGGTVADIVDNSLHIVVGANNISTAPVIAYYSRISFKE